MEEKYSPVCKGGGFYHNHKVNYSLETHSLIKRLLDESKLSILQRNNLQKSLKNGDPLPGPDSGRKNCQKINRREILIRPLTGKRRTHEAILESGAYEPEMYFPTVRPKDNEKEKYRLQSLMAYGKEESSETKDVKIRLKMNDSGSSKDKGDRNEKDDSFDHLLQEVEERKEFLEEMHKLGEGKRYKEMIENEIASKMRNMEIIDKERFKKQEGVVAEYRRKFINRGPPKSLPLTALEFPYT